jgi:hypothetical protein
VILKILNYEVLEIMPMSVREILATIAASAGQNGNFFEVRTVFVYLLSNFWFDNNLLIV